MQPHQHDSKFAIWLWQFYSASDERGTTREVSKNIILTTLFILFDVMVISDVMDIFDTPQQRNQSKGFLAVLDHGRILWKGGMPTQKTLKSKAMMI